MSAGFEILFHMGIMITVATIFTYIVDKFKQPLIIGYILAGLLVGPAMLGLIPNDADIITLGELGVAFLLFSAGMELDFKKLKEVGTTAMVGGLIQMIICFIFGYSVGIFFGLGPEVAVYTGILMTFSSTMIATKILVEKEELNQTHGRIIIAILILQDIIAIILLLVLADINIMFSTEIITLLINKAIILIFASVLMGIVVLPKLLDYAARKKMILFLTAIATLFFFLGIVTFLELSLGIGAFIAGIILASSRYKTGINAEMQYLREFFATIFFVALGAQLNPMVLLQMAPLALTLVMGVVILKPLILGSTFFGFGYGLRNILGIGLLLGQASEFAFIAIQQGYSNKVISEEIYSLGLGVVVITMAITPYLSKLSNWLYVFVQTHFSKERSLFARKLNNKNKDNITSTKLKDHIVIVGAHRIGNETVVKLNNKKNKIIVVEHDPRIIRELSEEGIKYVHGDISNEEILNKLNLKKAKMLVLTIPDISDELCAIKYAKEKNKNIIIIARAHTTHNALELYHAGADRVIVPEYISSHEMARTVDKILNKKENVKKEKKNRIKELLKHIE